MNTNTKPEFFIRGIHWRDAVNYYINNDKTQLPVLYYFGLARDYIRSYPNTWARLAMDYEPQWKPFYYNANAGIYPIDHLEERMVLLIENMLNEKREIDMYMEIEIKVIASMSQDEIELWEGLGVFY